MIKVEVGNLTTRVLSFSSLEEETLLRKSLTFKVPNYWFSPAYRRGAWDGTYSFWNAYSRTFPTGLFLNAPEALSRLFDVRDCRVRPTCSGHSMDLSGVELRDYQSEVADAAVHAGRAIISAPTNAGKTEIAAGIIKYFGVKTLWLTHRGNLMLQTQQRLEQRLGVKVGLLYKDVEDIQDITVAMVPTLHLRLISPNSKTRTHFSKLLKGMSLLMIDECHHTSASTWYNIAAKCPAYFRFGLSATPLMGEAIGNQKLLAMTGPEIKTVSNKDLIDRGISAKPTICVMRNDVSAVGYDWKTAYRVCVEENGERNALVARLVRSHISKGEPILIMVNTVRHGQALKRILGEDTVLITGKDPYADRQRDLARLESGEIKSITATPIFDEGADVPNIRVVVLAGVGKSLRRLLQRVGRGLRKKEGENSVTIYDFLDKGSLYLEKHSKGRLDQYCKEGFDIRFLGLEVLHEGVR